MNTVTLSKYVKCSIASVFLFPIVSLFVPLLNLLVINAVVYPLIVLGWMLGDPTKFARIDVFMVFPDHVSGFSIFALFWLVVGAIIGWIIYILRVGHARRKGTLMPSFGKSGVIMTIVLQLLVGFIFILPSGIIADGENQKSELAKLKYEQQNCSQVYTQKSHFKVTVCPKYVNGDLAATSEYYSEQAQKQAR